MVELIVRGNTSADLLPLVTVIFYPLLHFAEWRVARECAERAIRLGDPYVFGVALHQVQDWFTHRGEGYRFVVDGVAHIRHYLLRRWGSRRRVREFFRLHPRPQVESMLAALYPEVAFEKFSDEELLDLYLREWRLAEWEERERYGYCADCYYAHTNRDRAMRRWTQHLTNRFVERVLGDRRCMARIVRREYRPSLGALMTFYLGTVVVLAMSARRSVKKAGREVSRTVRVGVGG